MNNKVLIGVVILALGFGIGWYILRGNGNSGSVQNAPATTIIPETIEEASGTTPATDSGVSAEGSDKGGVVATTSVGYTDLGFTPGTITVKKGTTVVWTNTSAKGMWVASAMHPTHQLLPGFDQLKSSASGGSYEYTFVKVGTWKYHNHVGPTDTGSVIVTE